MRRRGSDEDKLANASWIALLIRAPAGDAGAGSFVGAGALAVGLFGERAFLFSGSRLRAIDAPAPGEVGVRGNTLESESSDEAPVRVAGVRGFTLSDNRVHALRGRGAPSQVRCGRAVVSGNDLRGLGDAPVLDVRLLGKGEAAILGNLRSGEILLNGNALPAPWAPLNPYSPE